MGESKKETPEKGGTTSATDVSVVDTRQGPAWGERLKHKAELIGSRVPVKGKSGKAYVHLYFDDEDRPVEIFITPSTDHDDREAVILLGRLGSLALQYGVPLKEIESQFIKAHEEAGTMGSDAHTIVKALDKLVREFKKRRKTAKASADTDDAVYAVKCPQCKAPMAFEEGCLKCRNADCGFSKC